MELDTPNGGGIGGLLRASRLRRGEELLDIASALRIRHVYMQAIEEDRFHDLPGHAYAVGFVRAYAEYLGLDGAEVVRRFKAQSDAPKATTDLSFPSFIPEHGIPRGAVLMVGILVAALGYGGWYFLSTADRFQTEFVAPVPERLQGGESMTVRTDSRAGPGREPSAAVAADTPARREMAAVTPEQSLPVERAEPEMPSEPATVFRTPVTEAPASVEAPDTEQTAAVETAPQAAPEPTPKPAPKPAPEPLEQPGDSAQTRLDDIGARAMPAAAAESETVAVRPAPAEDAAPAAARTGEPRIVVRAKFDSWVQIRDEDANQLILTRLLKGGDSYEVPDREGLVLMTGNAGALEISVDGETVPAIGGIGTVRRHVALEPDRLISGNAVVE